MRPSEAIQGVGMAGKNLPQAEPFAQPEAEEEQQRQRKDRLRRADQMESTVQRANFSEVEIDPVKSKERKDVGK